MYEGVMKAKLFDPAELKLLSDGLGALLESPLPAADENAIRALRTKTDALRKTIELLEPLTPLQRRQVASQYLAEEAVLEEADAIRSARDLQKSDE